LISKQKRKNSKDLFIRTGNSKHQAPSTHAFVNEFRPFKDKIIVREMTLRAGIFFSMHEIAFLSIFLQKNTMQ